MFLNDDSHDVLARRKTIRNGSVAHWCAGLSPKVAMSCLLFSISSYKEAMVWAFSESWSYLCLVSISFILFICFEMWRAADSERLVSVSANVIKRMDSSGLVGNWYKTNANYLFIEYEVHKLQKSKQIVMTYIKRPRVANHTMCSSKTGICDSKLASKLSRNVFIDFLYLIRRV